jgi:polyisoprenoid-binding protein YceI
MTRLLVITAALGLAVAGCSKDKDATPTGASEPTAAPATEPSSPAPTPEPATPQADLGDDYVRIVAEHANRKPSDPVIVSITRFRVVKATFDPHDLEGGTAELELDLTSLVSGSEKRDRHLRSDDYLDVDRFGVATIKVGNIKKTGDRSYAADATVSARGVDKVLPVGFEVLEANADAVKVKGSARFARLDWGIGQEPGPEDTAAVEMTLELQMTIDKT